MWNCYLQHKNEVVLWDVQIANSEQTKEMNFQMMHRELVGPLV